MKKSIKSLLVAAFLLSSVTSAFASEVYLYVTRHGKTMFNTVHRVQGWSDTPLTPPGIEVAEQLGRGLRDVNFVAAYSSDLGRARQTARIVLATKGVDLPLVEKDAFRETCFGHFEGDFDPNMWTPAAKVLGYSDHIALQNALGAREMTLDKIMNTFKSLDESGMGEDYLTVKTRMLGGLKEVAEAARAQGGGNVLIVTHGMALLAMINDLLDKPANGPVKNASVTLIRYTDNGEFIVESVGDTSYIEKGK